MRSLSGNVTLAVPAASAAEADGGGGGGGDELRLAWAEDAAAAPGLAQEAQAWAAAPAAAAPGGGGGVQLLCARSALAAPDIDDEIASDELLWCGAADVAVPPLAPGESHRHSLSLAPLRRGAFGVRARCVVGGRAVAEAEAPLLCDTLRLLCT